MPLFSRLAHLGSRLGEFASHSLLNRFGTPTLILCYHRVARLESDPWGLAVTPERFREHMQFIRARYPVLRFEEDWSASRRPAVVVTFDDGYADNLHEALPILEETGVPATFFVATATIGTRTEFWWDELCRLLLGQAAVPRAFALADARFGACHPTRSASERLALARHLQVSMKRVGSARREDWLGQLRRWAGAGDEGRLSHRALSVEELRRLACSPLVTIGAHTVTHPALARLGPERQREEILQSRHQLESWLGRPVEVFSYPYGGKEDCDGTGAAICRQAGFRKAASAWPGLSYRWSDEFLLPRRFVCDWDEARFKRYVSWWFGVAPARNRPVSRGAGPDLVGQAHEAR